MLQRAIEESKRDQPDPDQMTYEQLLALEEENGKVSKGLSQQDINKIPEKVWSKVGGQHECSICFDNLKKGEKVKTLNKCKHQYHS